MIYSNDVFMTQGNRVFGSGMDLPCRSVPLGRLT